MVDVRRLPDVALATLRCRDARGLPAVGASAMSGGDRIIALGPDEWLVVAADGDAAALAGRCARPGAAVIDASGSRVRFAIGGSGAVDLLAAGCALDLDRLPSDAAVATLVGRVAAIVVATDDGFVVLVPRSLATHFATWARSAAC